MQWCSRRREQCGWGLMQKAHTVFSHSVEYPSSAITTIVKQKQKKPRAELSDSHQS